MSDNNLESFDQTPDGYREVIKEHQRVIDGLLQTETALSDAIRESDGNGELSRRLSDVQSEIIARKTEIEKAEYAIAHNKSR